MTFHSIVRHWCSIYRFMLDRETNRRFFLTDSYRGMVEFAKGITTAQSPCVVMESDVEGYADHGHFFRNYAIYFFVRAYDMADGDAAVEAKEQAWAHAQQFLTWLRTKKEDDSRGGDFDRIDLEQSLDIQSVGPIENGWFAVLVQITRAEPLNLCVDENFYHED